VGRIADAMYETNTNSIDDVQFTELLNAFNNWAENLRRLIKEKNNDTD